MDFTQQKMQARDLVETRLASFFSGSGLEEAMRYSLMAGGKRIRPILTLKFAQAAGGELAQALDFACAVEMLHTYSLIHDDLPCMDNDDLRRGKPTSHKVFGECVATLAGDALQAAAFSAILNDAGGLWEHNPFVPAMAAKELAQAAGAEGMCGGQFLDTARWDKPPTLTQLAEIHDRKTGALLQAACVMGVLAASGSGEIPQECIEAARNYGLELGRAFQIQDDLLDASSTTEEFGKPVGSDRANGRATYVDLLGIEGCRPLILQHTTLAKAALDGCNWQGDTAFLLQLADELAQRSK